MATDAEGVRERLQAALGSAYTIERELGGGGIPRVFEAEDERLGRSVVIKVLHPGLAVGLSAYFTAAASLCPALLCERPAVSVSSATTSLDARAPPVTTTKCVPSGETS